MDNTLQVAFYKGRTRLFNRLVSWWLNGPYSHAELILDTDAGGYAACASSSFLDGGVRLKYMRLDPEHWDIVDVQGDKATAWAWLKEHDGDQYDTFGLLGLVWRRGKGNPDKVWCTESVAAMLGYDEPWRFDPMTLYVALTRGKT